jgi:hypothetical protein
MLTVLVGMWQKRGSGMSLSAKVKDEDAEC